MKTGPKENQLGYKALLEDKDASFNTLHDCPCPMDILAGTLHIHPAPNPGSMRSHRVFIFRMSPCQSEPSGSSSDSPTGGVPVYTKRWHGSGTQSPPPLHQGRGRRWPHFSRRIWGIPGKSVFLSPAGSTSSAEGCLSSSVGSQLPQTSEIMEPRMRTWHSEYFLPASW